MKNKNISEKKTLLRIGWPAWAARETELLEIPSVEEVTVPLLPPRLPDHQHKILNCAGITELAPPEICCRLCRADTGM